MLPLLCIYLQGSKNTKIFACPLDKQDFSFNCKFFKLQVTSFFKNCYLSLVHRWLVPILAQCAVPENIHTPTTEGIGNSRGVGWGGGGGTDGQINFQMVQFDSGLS